MPSYEYSHKHNAFIKWCSCCKEVTIGTASREESEGIFKRDFAQSGGSAQTRDGLQSRCRFCNSAGRRYLGITRAKISEMLTAQDGKCCICKCDIDASAHVDHDEKTRAIRGLLCGPCNQGIGLLKHSESVLRAAIFYLRQQPAAENVVQIKRRA